MTISAISGAALAAVCFTMSTALAGAAGTAAAAPLIRVLAFDILIGGLVAAPPRCCGCIRGESAGPSPTSRVTGSAWS